MSPAKKPEFTPKELTLIANMVVGRHDSLVEMQDKYPHMHDRVGLGKAIKAIAPVTEKLRPYYTGEDS